MLTCACACCRFGFRERAVKFAIRESIEKEIQREEEMAAAAGDTMDEEVEHLPLLMQTTTARTIDRAAGILSQIQSDDSRQDREKVQAEVPAA